MMTWLKTYLGVALVFIGALLLIGGYVAGWTSSNLFLLSGWILVFLGTIVHVKHLKESEKY